MLEETYLLSDTIIFDAKPIAVPYNYRISYKIGQLMLIIHFCCRPNSGCSLTKLHLISSALNSENSIQELSSLDDGHLPENMVVHFDPVVNRALLYGISDGIVKQQRDGKLRLTPHGEEYIEAILEDDTLMKREKTLLSKISTKVTEKHIKEIMSVWRYQNAAD